jgi:hypothetical protein
MLRLETKTRLTQEEAMKRILKYFRGYKMKIVSQAAGCVTFEGGGGGVNVETTTKDGVTTIDLVSREWDQQVKDFVDMLPQRVRPA